MKLASVSLYIHTLPLPLFSSSSPFGSRAQNDVLKFNLKHKDAQEMIKRVIFYSGFTENQQMLREMIYKAHI